MKTSWLDYFVIGFTMLMLSVISVFFTWSVSSIFDPWLSTTGNSILFILGFPTIYGLLSGVVLRGSLYFKPLPEGEFSMEDSVFQYWKFLTMIHMFGERALFVLCFPPFVPLIAKLFGAEMGKNIAIGGRIDSPFLVSIGDNSVLGHGSLVSGNVIQDNKIILGRVKIGNQTTLGVFSVVMPAVQIGNHVKLVTGSVVVQGSVIPDHESWKGNPARKWQ